MATQTMDGMEPRFSLPDSTPKSSKTVLAIGGLKIYVYGLEEAIAGQTPDSHGDLAVFYLAHNRTRTYLVTEGIAHEVLYRYREDSTRARSTPLIAVTMNMRNHGDRESQIYPPANRTWQDGNEQHAMDLVSIISGSAQDFKLVLDYLPAYVPQFTRFYNVMAGVSLGAHTAWRIASLASPGQIHAYYVVSRDDRKVADEFPTDVPLLLCNGVHDKLVPAKHTASWVEDRRRRNQESGIEQDITFFMQDNTGHSCTKEMVAMMAVWLRDILPPSPRSPRSSL
ncbi:hypothetical protein N7468_010587 [Penicillium chermesinum]|uniref:Uncharacterized protein n=1 Tax=Penicillium chermesinum TaxID=63820 RepID=A0A9W9T9V4_9EURO|nr:uncharacterized protein N7468_010587 [Penicillium chermesinum]KAJ5214908.1 hypothetical protein N7468_010587 [Penicillium chermesinum]KAJ6141590.1 hypothetical protein N7470_009980 [Penicillium chermesinum]